MSGTEVTVRDQTDGAAAAALLGAGAGAFAVGLFTLLNEAGAFVAPTLYGPAGGVSGRTTFAAVVWVAAWTGLHYRWRARRVSARAVCVAAIAVTALGVAATFPPVWGIF